MDKEDILKEMFREMCGFIVPYHGKLIYLYEEMDYDTEYDWITRSEHYEILKIKMKNLLKLVNKDLSLMKSDLELELWDKI